MPYNLTDNIPATVKNLPTGAIKIFVETFNAVLADTDDEDDARRAAWKNVKLEYKKDGETWVKKEKKASEGVEASDDEQTVGIELVESVICFDTFLQEAEFNDDNKTATVTVIKEGWSLNKTNNKRRYYTGGAVEDVVTLLKSSKKMYKDHQEKNGARSLTEWVATVNESWVENVNGVKLAKGKIDFTNNPNTVWLYYEGKKHPEEVGVSIAGNAKIREGKIGNEDASVIERIVGLASADFVTRQAAGGQIDKIKESVQSVNVLSEAFSGLEDRVKQQEMGVIWNALQSLISDLMYSDEISKGNVSEEVNKALKIFEDKCKEYIGNERDKWEKNSIKAKEEVNIKKEKVMNLDDFKKEHPEAFEKLEEQINLLAKNDAEKSIKEQQDKVALEMEEAKKQVTELTESVKTKDEELKTVNTKLAEYVEKEKVATKKIAVAEKIKEAKLEATEEFINILMEVQEEMIDKLIKIQVDTVASKVVEGKITGFGAPPKGKQEVKKISDEDKNKMLYESKKK